MFELFETYGMSFGFVLVRIMAILYVMPIWSGKYPHAAKAAISIWMGILFTFALPPVQLPADMTVGTLVTGLVREILMGGLLGTIVRLYLAGVMLAGQFAGYSMGLGIANVYDPATSEQISVLASLLNILMMFLFLQLDGHLLAVKVLVKSFEWIPVFSAHLTGMAFLDLVREGGATVFMLGIRIAWPFTCSILLVYMSLGLLNKMAPKMHMMMLALPFAILTGVSLLMFGMGPLMERFTEVLTGAFDSIELMLLALRT